MSGSKEQSHGTPEVRAAEPQKHRATEPQNFRGASAKTKSYKAYRQKEGGNCGAFRLRCMYLLRRLTVSVENVMLVFVLRPLQELAGGGIFDWLGC
jgi:hypothetical protein